MTEILERLACADTAPPCDTSQAAREAARNRLCELRLEPAFAEWWRLTTALGLEECLLLLASEAPRSLPGGASAETVAALGRAARLLDQRAREGEDRWLNPLFPVPLPEVAASLIAATIGRRESPAAPLAAASAD